MKRTYSTAATLVGLISLLVGGVADADITLYSNITNFSGEGYPGGGSASVGGLGTTTAMVADDITPVAGSAGASITGLDFSVANFNSTSVTAEVLLTFYDTTGTNGGPGNYLGGLLFGSISFTGGAVQVFGYDPGTTLFTVPTSGTFWVGEQFVASGTTTSTQLDSLGLGIFGPPTIGSSQDVFFQSSSSGSTLTSDPTGGFFNFGGTPPANFGFAFTGTPLVVPEPSSLALCGMAGLGLAGIRLARVLGRRLTRDS